MVKQMNDISLSTGEDLFITAGDFAIVESTSQHQQELLLTSKGDWKENPLVGIGIEEYFDDEAAQNIIRAIAQQFMADGMEVLDLNPNPISIADSSVKIFEKAYYR